MDDDTNDTNDVSFFLFVFFTVYSTVLRKLLLRYFDVLDTDNKN